ncbi:MAG: translation initiation factor IF-2 subunit alpha [Candidatus Woesearchaeota archaeon]|jgi:translation initiation factor 2 subunit 1|nr:translation initiation factor IF-2 subunit alpha [Candidatus Woesearchaeota archaeon]MDP7622764.1 translation initiation factor IF-2 subunit alpha [Candidatus Woesearchaeota archaeon]HJN56440.1 translation initiation factor IF-2 subunit alpha [Candidatus Woesearchaeota archaeon]|tara:strand:+ start:43325 stop:44107 length:783 start_codon:yes stop_codon:yes gene_type:complete
MLLKKEGFPEEDELAICTVTKVQFHSVFANLDEYGKGGMIHISEVSPGRIRNIRDFVKEGKKVVCKVLRINTDRGHIDLSLRRVTEGQKRNKIDELKQEQKAEKILEFVAKDLKIDVKKLFYDITKNISEKYASLYGFFQQVVVDSAAIKDAGVEEKTAEKIVEAVKSRIKEASIKIEGKLKLTSFASNGIDIIKEALKKAEEIGKKSISIKYLGAGSYNIIINAKEYKDAEKLLKEASEKAIEHVMEYDGEGEFTRVET